jgi:plastocyanin
MPSKKLFLPSLAAAAALSLGAATGASAAGHRVIKVDDACDPASFNAVLGDGACVRDNSGPTVGFESFIAKLQKKGGDSRWRFDRTKVRIAAGDSLRIVRDKGGEGHTFSEVPAFGPGCVPEINALIGADGPPVSDCSEALEPTYVGPGRDSFEITGLTSGTHYFECLIHPWMQTTVVVR